MTLTIKDLFCRVLKAFLPVILLATPCTLAAQTAADEALPERYFPYPQVPDNLQTLQERTDYLMEHFWEMCDLKKAFSSKPKMAGALDDYLSFVRYASRDAALASIDNLLDKLKKQPEDLLFTARQAEAYLYSDTAEFHSDEAYLPFVKAVVSNKKIAPADKARFQHQLNLIERSGIGTNPPAMTYLSSEGESRSLANDTAEVLILFFMDPDCIDCRIAKARLDANTRATELIGAGIIKVVGLYPDEPTQEWVDYSAHKPEHWILGSAPDATDYFDLRTTPEFYVYDENHRLLLKHIDIDTLLEIINRL